MVTRTHTHSPEEWRRFDNYHYDPAVYEEGKECRTCKVPKYVPRCSTHTLFLVSQLLNCTIMSQPTRLIMTFL